MAKATDSSRPGLEVSNPGPSGLEPRPGALIDPRVRARLRGLATTLRLRLLLRGLGWTAAALLVAAWASLVADYGLYRLTLEHLSLVPRLLVNGLCAAGVAVVAWKRLVRAVFRSFTDVDLAALVEQGHPQLEDRLISAVQFAQASAGPLGASPELIRQLTGEANDSALKLRFLSVLRSRPMWTALLNAGGLLALSAALVWGVRDVAAAWAKRNVLLRRSSSYPRQTILQVVGGSPIRVLRGDPLRVTVTARAGRVAPEHVVFHMRFPSVGQTAEAVPASPGDGCEYVKTFPMVNEPFTFHVTGNDDRTGHVRVEVVERAELRELDLEVRSPVYTGLAPRKIRRGAVAIDVLADSAIALAGLSTKDLAEAAIYLGEQRVGSCRIHGSGAEAHRRIEAQLAVRAPEPYRPCLALRIALRDAEGFDNPKAASYNVRLAQDQPPAAHVEAAGMGGEITNQAAVPLTVTARDDYGVTAIHLQWSVQSAPQKTQEQILKAYQPASPEPAALPYVFDLRQVASRGDTGAPPLQVGETLRLQATAIDSRPAAAGGTQKATSNLITFRIVTADELLAKALELQRAVREQIRQVIEMQRDVRQRCRTAIEQAGQPTTLGLALREVASALDTQQQIEDLLQEMVGRLEALLERLRNNRAVPGEDEVRLRVGVIEPLRKVAEEAVPALVRRFEAARSVGEAGSLTAELNALVALQDGVIRVLEAVVGEMIKVETAQHVESTLRALIKLGDQVRDLMKTGRGDGASSRPSGPGGPPQPEATTKPREPKP